jgi:hydroxymethylpyrimidine/phosphomethylpyrimidine kinase
MIARALTIAGSDSGGGAGIQADLKTFTVFGVYGMTAITALTAQNTLGVSAVEAARPEIVRAQIDSVVSDIGVDAAKTGMLATRALVETVAAALRDHRVAPLVVDPVMVAESGGRLLADDARGVLLRELLPLAALVTPNLAEAEALLEMPVASLTDMREAARRLVKAGAAAALVKGGHLGGSEAVDVFHDGTDLHELRAPRIFTPHTHGTGCMLAAAIVACLASKLTLHEAVHEAKRFITAAIGAGLPLGRGHGPANPLAWAGKRG